MPTPSHFHPCRFAGPFLALLCFFTFPVDAANNVISVDFDHATKSGVNTGAAGANLCWLMDSDLHRKQSVTVSQALADMGVGALRFPYGHLADNYLWNSPPSSGVLHPKVAAAGRPPGKWTWAAKPDGSMPGAMDFDEYMALCRKIDAKPLVCVNVLSFKYPGGPTYQQLKDSAVAWVKYASMHQYKVAYWEIGNEVDHPENSKLLPMDEYIRLYEDFARAMKAADPSAQTGPGILSSVTYYQAIAKKCPSLVDFISVHQYMWSWKATCVDYAGWRDCTDPFVKNIDQAAQALKRAGLPKVPLLVTETGVTGGRDLGETNNTYKALWNFEILVNQLSHPSVAYSFYWGTHSPWDYTGADVEPSRDIGVALRLKTNARTPTGEIMRLINSNLLDEFVTTSRVVGRLRCYAMRSYDGRRRVLFILNKDDQPASVEVPFLATTLGQTINRIEFSGKSSEDVSPATRELTLLVQASPLRIILPPLSLTILRCGDSVQ